MNTFICRRTSGGWKDKPCEEAYEKPVVSIDIRTVDDPAKVKAYIGEPTDWWYSTGTNHRVEHGQIVRDMGEEIVWVVDIDNILDFIKKYGECVISYYIHYNMFQIEIYDDYRE